MTGHRNSSDTPTLAPPIPITFPEPTYSAAPHVNRIFTTPAFRYSYQSLVSPPSVYEYNVAQPDSPPPSANPNSSSSRKSPAASTPPSTPPSASGSKPPPATTESSSLKHRIIRPTRPQPSPSPSPSSTAATSSTATAPIPLYIYGYGSYGYPLPVGFSPSRLSLLDRGVVIAYAHIRGGGELGDAWHDAGKMQLKRNTFTDFIAVTEHLTAQSYGDPTRVAIEGGSAGGLLMGAVTNMRPDLFRVVLSHVPFVDIMNTMLDATLPLTVAEYEEWGNPNEPEAFRTMLAYSPYDNLESSPRTHPRHARQNQPQRLTSHVLGARQVRSPPPHHQATTPTPLLLHINMDAGHGGASGRYDYLKEIAFDYAFLLTQLGIVTSL